MSEASADSNAAASRLHAWGFVALALTHILISLHEIAAPYFAGHHGWNAALRSVIGRNYMKYGFLETGFAPYKHFGFAESLDGLPIHWHHPPTVNLLVGASFSIFGEHAWAAHLVSVVPAIAIFFLLYGIVRERWGERVALLACAIFTFLPMQIEWGKMLNYEVQIVAAAMAGLYAADRYRSAHGRARWWWGAASCAALCLAGSFDWPGFILAAFVGVDALVREGWRKPQLFIAIGVSTTLTLVAWLLWLESFAGDGGLMELAQWRSGGKVAFATMLMRQAERLVDYYGPVSLALSAFGVVWAAWRRRCADGVVVVFFLGNLLYISIFKQAAYVHLFYLYFATPAFAVATALGVLGLTDVLGRVHPRAPAIGLIAALLAISATIGPRIPTTHWRSYKILRPAHPAKGFPWDGELHRIVVGKLLNERSEPTDHIVFHRHAGATLQMRYYADRAFTVSRSPRPPRRARFWVVPDRLLKTPTLRTLAKKAYITRIAHLAIVDLTPESAGSETLVIQPGEPSLAHDFWVSSVVGPWRVEPAPKLHAAWKKRHGLRSPTDR